MESSLEVILTLILTFINKLNRFELNTVLREANIWEILTRVENNYKSQN